MKMGTKRAERTGRLFAVVMNGQRERSHRAGQNRWWSRRFFGNHGREEMSRAGRHFRAAERWSGEKEFG
jgi:hypothetical protein